MTMNNIADAINTEIAERQLLRDAVMIGGVHSFDDYQNCQVLTHDHFMVGAGGVPRGTLLLATILKPGRSGTEGSGMPDFEDEEILLLRVNGPAPLYNEAHLLELRTEAMRVSMDSSTTSRAADVLTQNEAAFVGLHTSVLGTFYTEDCPNADGASVSTLCFSQDIETFYSISQYQVYKPMGEGLRTISSFPEITPQEIELGHSMDNPPPRSRLGTLRYASTRRRQMKRPDSIAPVNINIRDFIGNKSALFGMTRMGKSNTMKVIAAETLAYSTREEHPVGQLILDPSGEYSTHNQQDGDASLMDTGVVHRYHWAEADPANNTHSVRFNFFERERLPLALGLLERAASQAASQRNLAGQIQDLFQLGFEDVPGNQSETTRARRRRSLLYSILVRAGFTPPSHDVYVPLRADQLRELHCATNQPPLDPLDPNSSPDAVFQTGRGGTVRIGASDLPQFFDRLLETHRQAIQHQTQHGEDDDYEEWAILDQGTSGDYFHQDHGIPTMFRVHNPTGNFRGYHYLSAATSFHSITQQEDPVDDIVQRLSEGELCIVTSFNIPEEVMTAFSHRLVDGVLANARTEFQNGNSPPDIQVFIDEAHNILGKDSFEMNRSGGMDPFTMLAKEGGKFNIGMIYATQEVHLIDDLILSNTANWVVTHLNSKREIKVLSDYYDFAEFGDMLLQNEVVGYAICRTKSCPYTLPVQIERFSEDHVNRICSPLSGTYNQEN